MIRNFRHTALAASLALTLAGFTGASFAATAPQNVDLGVAASSQPTTVTLVLRLRNQDALEQYIKDSVTPGNAHFHKFLSTSEFASKYGASDADVAQVKSFLQKQGLAAEVLDNHMVVRATGTLAQIGSAFQTSVHDFRSAATGQQFHAPTSTLSLSPAISSLVVATSGLSNEKKYVSHGVKAQDMSAASKLSAAVKVAGPTPANPTASGVIGSYTVGDVANFYNIGPLYQAGIDGKGSTLAVVTLSDFNEADAENYWSSIGLPTKADRITKIHVDGGAVIDLNSGQTAIAVEQSGGLAPQADILVYDAPNAGNGLVDAFARAVSDNKADSISTSWGGPEILNFAAFKTAGASASDTTDAGDLTAFHNIFLEAAVQGQSVFVAAGDSGAYDTVAKLGHGTSVGTYNAPLTVDSPASDPYVTAAGGTTLPHTYNFGGPDAVIAKESVWGWDYVQNYFDTNFGPGQVDEFAKGTGGGVSVYWHTPFYQLLTQGIKKSEKGQALVFNDPVAGPVTKVTLPGGFQGRNLPDVALNADPLTGYAFVSSVDGGGLIPNGGGTVFVASQLNGISALLSQSTGHRLGLWNPQVYAMQLVFGYGSFSPFNDIQQGDNWFYQGAKGYEPGAGIGTLDVSKLDLFFKSGL